MMHIEPLLQDAPGVLRLVIGAAGLLVLLWGARVYRTALVASSFGVGVVGGVALVRAATPYFPDLIDPNVVLVGAAASGVVVALVALAAHRVALMGIGGVVGVVVTHAVVRFMELPLETSWPIAGGCLAGAVAFPFVFPLVLRVATPAVGAVLLSWALAMSDALWLIVLLWAVGVAFQLGIGRESEEEGS